MHLHYSGKRGDPPEYGSDEHLFLVACSTDDPEIHALMGGISEEDAKIIVRNLQYMGWGFFFVTLH